MLASLGSFWAPVGALLALSADFGRHFGASGAHFGAFGAHFGASGAHKLVSGALYGSIGIVLPKSGRVLQILHKESCGLQRAEAYGSPTKPGRVQWTL